MTISDSLPVQFWDINDETFNEKQVCGLVKQDCYCQPFECDDTIVIQVQSDQKVEVEILSSDSEILETLSMTEVTTGVWEKSFIPSELGSPAICDQQIQLKIKLANIFLNSTFSHLDPWENVLGLGSAATKWSAISGKAQSTFTEFSPTQYLSYTYAFKLDVSYTITFDFTKSSGTNYITLSLSNSPTWASSTLIQSISPIVDGSYSVTFISPGNFSYISFSAGVSSGSGSRTVTLDNIRSIETYLAKSDCLDIRQTQDCTQLIEYSNSSDFDGLIYGIESPDPTFYLRVPAVFYEEKNPQEQEDLELSNGRIVTIRQSIQEKRLLDLGFMPNYMHRKVQKVLMHETISIDGDNWKKRDSYDDSPVKKYNLKRATVLLTKYDSVEKNTI
jgi:hypothetical protein